MLYVATEFETNKDEGLWHSLRDSPPLSTAEVEELQQKQHDDPQPSSNDSIEVGTPCSQRCRRMRESEA
jgi:hypothetical protein